MTDQQPDIALWSGPERDYTAAPSLFDLLPFSLGLDTAYGTWVADHDMISEEDQGLIRTQVDAWPDLPRVSVLMPLGINDLTALRQSLDSLTGQVYPAWELCIAWDSGVTTLRIDEILHAASVHDPRIILAGAPGQDGAAACTEHARGCASGTFVAVLYAGDMLAPHALYEVARELRAFPTADVIFTDEDCIDNTGRRTAPCFKPMWNPELLAAHDCIGHLVAYRASLVEAIGGWRSAMEGAQDWDVALRATAATTPERIRHIPAMLYRRDATVFPLPLLETTTHLMAGRRAVTEWLAAKQLVGVELLPNRLVPSANRLMFPLPSPLPLVTIIMPTRDRAELLERACIGVLSGTDWTPDCLELIVVDNGSTELSALKLLRSLDKDKRVRVLSIPGSFNYSALNNRAASIAQGTVLVLLNNDVEIQNPDWLAELVRLALYPEIGVVGAKLLYPDGTVQHGGMAVGANTQVGHILRCTAGDDPAYLGQLAFARTLSAVTGACLATRKEVFEEVGGLDEELAVTYNDNDFCMRVRARGYRVVWTPDAVLVHHESATRGQDSDRRDRPRADQELAYVRNRWGRMMEIDPYHNPNLRLQDGASPLIFAPPRRPRPWREWWDAEPALANHLDLVSFSSNIRSAEEVTPTMLRVAPKSDDNWRMRLAREELIKAHAEAILTESGIAEMRDEAVQVYARAATAERAAFIALNEADTQFLDAQAETARLRDELASIVAAWLKVAGEK